MENKSNNDHSEALLDERAQTVQSLIQTLRSADPGLPAAALSAPPEYDDDDRHYDHARIGKIARLPAGVRETVNLMLHENAPYAAIIEKLAELGHPGFTPSNITRWKEGGHRHWLYRRQQTEALQLSSKANLEMLQQLTPEEQQSLHKMLELTFVNHMLSALAHIKLDFSLSDRDADTLAKLGDVISRHFRERTRSEWLQLARTQQLRDPSPPPK
jgi:hypothetical protein